MSMSKIAPSSRVPAGRGPAITPAPAVPTANTKPTSTSHDARATGTRTRRPTLPFVVSDDDDDNGDDEPAASMAPTKEQKKAAAASKTASPSLTRARSNSPLFVTPPPKRKFEDALGGDGQQPTPPPSRPRLGRCFMRRKPASERGAAATPKEKTPAPDPARALADDVLRVLGGLGLLVGSECGAAVESVVRKHFAEKRARIKGLEDEVGKLKKEKETAARVGRFDSVVRRV
ncbi:hypothetical protein BDY21DRAFT_361763 [Lineolata rhizophorae]|uniref:Uncharacterized protein n=1 Tax=Lineolata rhizophorae TaxID=578093 RepID=A0A6A6P777_9PEZI|nr:hypothetical protein BDY21DRAFT_361763 [Lineolata rhizophorae]